MFNTIPTAAAQAIGAAATNGDMLKLFWTLATNPLTGYAVGALVSFVLYVVLKDAHARTVATAAADYVEFIERQAVIAAELAGWVKGIAGYDKLVYACDFVEAQLAKQGIVGDPDRVNRERVMADLERIKGEVFPGKGTILHQIEEAMQKNAGK